MRRIPSALVSVVTEPAVRGSGVATIFSPTLPMFTLKNSSIPNFEGMSLEGLTDMDFTFGGLQPSKLKSRGLTNCSKESMAETVYPGLPTTGLPSTIPRIVGFPGIMDEGVEQMGQASEGGQASALGVNEHQLHLSQAVMHGQASDHGTQEFGLA